MKHAVVKVQKLRKIAAQTQPVLVENERKTADSKASQPKVSKAKMQNQSAVTQDKKIKKDSISATVVAFPKSKTDKSATVFSVEKTARKKTDSALSPQKIEKKKNDLTVAVKSKTLSIKAEIDQQNSKPRVVSDSTRQEKAVSAPIKKQKSQTAAPLNISGEKRHLKKETDESTAAVQTGKLSNKRSKNTVIEKTEAKVAKKNTFFSINKIKVIERKANLPVEKTGEKREEKIAESVVPVPEAISVEMEIAAKNAVRKPKPKKIKAIGPAVFRGRKERYDFQVYPLDAEFIDVPGIYIISKRKTDKQKRAHHALVCIGQTESLLGEIKKHKNKCIKKHNANVISILPEESEKKRLRIEEDLKAAHAIVCTI